MKADDIGVTIAGAAGDGSGSAASEFLRSCSRRGLHVFATYNYQSAIRGGHIYWGARVSSRKVLSQGDDLDLLVAFNSESISIHGPRMPGGGAVIFNSDRTKVPPGVLKDGVAECGIPVGELTNPYGRLPIMQNTVAMGAATFLLGLDAETFEATVREVLRAKPQNVQDDNVAVARAGHEYAKAHFKPLGARLEGDGKRRFFLSGNEALGAGLLNGGCRFYSAYPMTPATGILHYLVKEGPKHGMFVKQAEDEIAVVNMAIGASHMGVRAACGTSGGGYSLMVEATGLAAMIEDPLVMVDVMRVGPSTGLPTKTEQGDLFLVLGAGQGDWPRCVISPLTVEDCCLQAQRALNIADRWQTPVTLLSDLYLGEHFETVDALDLDSVGQDRGALLSSWEGGEYRRYLVTESGVSPRVVPGTPRAAYTAGSDEHDEDGGLISDVRSGLPASLPVRRKMMEKRMRKLEGMRAEMGLPEVAGDPAAEVTLVGWGSTYRLLIEAMERLNASGTRADVVAFRDLYPMRCREISAILKARKRLILVESNFTGQLGRLIGSETGVDFGYRLLKYDGEPFTPGEIVSAARSAAGGGNA